MASFLSSLGKFVYDNTIGLITTVESTPPIEEIKKSVEEGTAAGKAIETLKGLGITDEESRKIAAATLYDRLEQQGVNLDEFWGGIPEGERELLRFSPQALKQELAFDTFFGIADVLLWIVGGVATGVTALRGVPIALETINGARKLIAAGKSTSEVTNFLNIQKLASIAKLAIPAAIAAVSTGLAWASQAILQTLGDPIGWGRRAISQAEQKFVEIARQSAKILGPQAPSAPSEQAKTRITMTKQAKPTLFLGTLFSSRVKTTDAFERLLDDKITDRGELQSDAQVNLNRWLKSLPGRLLYTINVQNSPFDEYSIKHSGTWVTLTILTRRISGQTVPLDTILLGPVDPLIYYPKPTETQAVQVELPKLLTAEEVTKIELPTGEIRFVDKTGATVPISLEEGVKIAPSAAQPGTAGTSLPSSVAPSTPPKPSAAGGTVAAPAAPAAPTLVKPYKVSLVRQNSAVSYDIITEGGIVMGAANYADALAKAQAQSGNFLGVFTAGMNVDQAIKTALAAMAPAYPRTVTVNIDAVMVRDAPSSTAPLAGAQRLTRGTTFKVTGSVTGESVEGESRWWISEYGNYVWVGGTAEKP